MLGCFISTYLIVAAAAAAAASLVITAVTDGEVDEDIRIYFNDLRSNRLACRVINECNRLGRVEFGTDTSPAQVVYNAIKS